MKNNRYFYFLFALTIISFSLSYLGSRLGHLNEGDAIFPYSVVKRYADQGQTWMNVSNQAAFSSPSITEMDIQTVSTEVSIFLSTGQSIEISLEGKYLPRSKSSGQILQTEVEGNRLKVKTDEDKLSQNFQFSEGLNSGNLTIHIPKTLKKLIIKTLSGKVSCVELNLNLIGIETQSGEVDLRNIHSKRIDFKSSSGEASVSGDFEQFNGESRSGDLQITSDNAASEIKFSSVSSDAEVYYKNKPSIRLEFQTTNGSLRSEGVGADFESSGPYSNVWGSGAGELQVHSVSGNLSVGLDE